MRIMGTLVGILVVSIVVYFFVLAYVSKSKISPGLVSGQLTACSVKPNCVCSESNEASSHFIEPIAIIPDDTLMPRIKALLDEMGTQTILETESYLAVTFTSGFFKFVDDFELRIDQANNLLHVRSASRVGHSDMGVNRKRVEMFKARLNAQVE